MKYKTIQESGIPYVEYSSKEECLFDNSEATKKHLNSYKPEKNKYENQFAFIFKIKNMKNDFIVINCFSSSILVENISYFDDFEEENERFSLCISKSSYNLKKALNILDIYKNDRKLLTKSKFWYLVKLFKKSYKNLECLKSYDYAHIKKHLKTLQSNKSIQGYYYIQQNE